MGSARFDVFGAFKLFKASTIDAQLTSTPAIKELDTDNLYPYLSIALVMFEYITPTFNFKSTGLHYLTRKDNLIPFVLSSENRQCRPVDRIEIQGLGGAKVSIDGEPYTADSLIAEVIQKCPTQMSIEEDKPSLALKGPQISESDSTGFLGKVLRIA